MRIRLAPIAGLVVLLFAMDQLFRILYPEVNLVRASLVGLTAAATLGALSLAGLPTVPALLGGLTVFASASVSVVAIENGLLVSRSAPSAAVHVALVALAYPALEAIRARAQRWREARMARTSSSGTSSGTAAPARKAAASTRIVSR